MVMSSERRQWQRVMEVRVSQVTDSGCGPESRQFKLQVSERLSKPGVFLVVHMDTRAGKVYRNDALLVQMSMN